VKVVRNDRSGRLECLRSSTPTDAQGVGCGHSSEQSLSRSVSGTTRLAQIVGRGRLVAPELTMSGRRNIHLDVAVGDVDLEGSQGLLTTDDIEQLDSGREVCPVTYLAGPDVEPRPVKGALDLTVCDEFAAGQRGKHMGAIRLSCEEAVSEMVENNFFAADCKSLHLADGEFIRTTDHMGRHGEILFGQRTQSSRHRAVIKGMADSCTRMRIPARRGAPEIQSVAHARRVSEAHSATQRTDDSVLGVVEFQSVPGVAELRVRRWLRAGSTRIVVMVARCDALQASAEHDKISPQSVRLRIAGV
jgi:hypothetical protein